MTVRISMLKSPASPDMPFSLCNKKRLAIRHNDIIDSVVRHREVGRAKDLSAPLVLLLLLIIIIIILLYKKVEDELNQENDSRDSKK
jgi:hypothetical protein